MCPPVTTYTRMTALPALQYPRQTSAFAAARGEGTRRCGLLSNYFDTCQNYLDTITLTLILTLVFVVPIKYSNTRACDIVDLIVHC